MSKEVESVNEAGTTEIRQVYAFCAALCTQVPLELFGYPSQTSCLVGSNQQPWAYLLGEPLIDAPTVEILD